MIALILTLALGCVADDIATLQAELAQAQEDLDELEAQLAQAQADADADAEELTAEIAELETEIATLQAELAAVQTGGDDYDPFAIFVRTASTYSSAGGDSPYEWAWSVEGPAISAVEVVIAQSNTGYNVLFSADTECGTTGRVNYAPGANNMWIVVWQGDTWSCFSPNPGAAPGCSPTIPTVIEDLGC